MAGTRGKIPTKVDNAQHQEGAVMMNVRDDLARRVEIFPGEAGPSSGRVEKKKKKRAPRKPHRANTLSRLTTLRMGAKETRLVILGHSWVERLSRLGIKSLKQDGRKVEVDYKFKRGLTFEQIIGDERLLHEVGKYLPHYVLVILGGNDVGSPKHIEEVENECAIFHSMLREFVPQAVIITSQMENRFYDEDNEWGAPTGEEFEKKRKRYNRFVHWSLREKDYLLRMGAPAHQEDQSCFEDCAHLTPEEYGNLFDRIKGVLTHIHRDMDTRIEEETAGDAADDLTKKLQERVAESSMRKLADKISQRVRE